MRISKSCGKIEKVGPQVIQTVWGVGYKFDDAGAALMRYLYQQLIAFLL